MTPFLDIMRRWKIVVLVVLFPLGVAGWYFFRPERAFIDVHVDEAPPSAEATVLAQGEFTPETHIGRGTATILRFAGDRRVLRFTSFETLNGPDVRVYLLGSRDVRSREALEAAGYLDLGSLKGNVGDQNYDIPVGADLARYPVVAVWCRRFGVNFTQAMLSTL